MNISHYGFVGPVNFSNEKYIRVKKKKCLDILLRKKISGIQELFANSSHLTNIIPIPIGKFWNSQTIPIPIRTEVGSKKKHLPPPPSFLHIMGEISVFLVLKLVYSLVERVTVSSMEDFFISFVF